MKSKLTPSQVSEIRELIGQGITYVAIGNKFKVHPSVVGQIKKGLTHKDTTEVVTAPAVPAPERISGKGAGRGRPKYTHLIGRIQELKAQGFRLSEVARQVGMPKGSVSNYFYKKEASQTQQGESTNGHKHLDTKFLVGFGCAEIDRTIEAIAQRLGIASTLLRQGFSKFLAS